MILILYATGTSGRIDHWSYGIGRYDKTGCLVEQNFAGTKQHKVLTSQYKLYYEVHGTELVSIV